MENETAQAPVPVFTDAEFIAFLEEQGFWTEGLLAETANEEGAAG